MSSSSSVEDSRDQDEVTASISGNDGEPLIRSDFMRLEIEIQCNALAMVSDEVFEFNAEDSVKNNLVAFLTHKKVNPRFHDVMAFRDRQHRILNYSKSLRENGVREGDKLWLCNTGGGSGLCFNYPVYFVFGLFVVYCLAMLIIVIFNLLYPHGLNTSHGSAESLNYGLVIDAGSVHTTLSVYYWNSLKLNGTGIVKESLTCETNANVGIDTFATNPRGVRNYLVQSKCFRDAVSAIPEEQRSRSNVFLGATAGMRILNATDPVAAQMIMSNISVALNNSELMSSRENVKILYGSEEGILGWITSNYLSNVFITNKNEKGILGALDWGGASSQITFALSNEDHMHTNSSKREMLYGNYFNVYTKSHLCFGQAEALRRYFVRLVHKSFKAGILKTRLSAPCQPKDGEILVQAKDLFYSPCTIYKEKRFQSEVQKLPKNATFTFFGRSDKLKCLKEIKQAFDFKLCSETYKETNNCFDPRTIPKPPSKDTKFLAFSTYWYLKSFLKIHNTTMSEDEFHQSVQRLCTNNVTYARGLLGVYGHEVEQNSCFRGLFMHYLLTKGYHLTEWRTIEFVKRVSRAEVGWTLGYMILKTNDVPSVEFVLSNRDGRGSYTYFLISMAVLLVLWFYVGLLCCKIHSSEEAKNNYEYAVRLFMKPL